MYNDELTKKIIAGMLKENTGKHFLDSGDFYGRNWQLNQIRNFENEPSVYLEFHDDWIEYTRNIYHFLTESLTYEKNLTRSFYTFERNVNKGLYSDKFLKLDKYSTWFELIPAWLKFKGYAEGLTENIYNYENNISQVFQFTLFSDDYDSEYSPDIYDCPYVILMIHGGCDVRGGYTEPKIFSWDDQFLMTSDGYIYCSGNYDHRWYTDDNNHWYTDDYGQDLDKYELTLIDEYLESSEYQEQLDKMIIVPSGQNSFISGYNPSVINPVKYPENVIFYDSENNGYCPVCSFETGELNKLEG